MASTDLRAPAGHLALPFFDDVHRDLAVGLPAQFEHATGLVVDDGLRGQRSIGKRHDEECV